jgi:hypothetical protein
MAEVTKRLVPAGTDVELTDLQIASVVGAAASRDVAQAIEQ